MIPKSETASIGNPEDLVKYARWCRERYERRFGAAMTDAEREDFESDAVVTMLETFQKHGVKLADDKGLAYHATAVWREAGIEHVRRRAVVFLSEHALASLAAIRDGSIDELETKRRERDSRKRGKASKRGCYAKHAPSAAEVLAMVDVFSREEMPDENTVRGYSERAYRREYRKAA
jgi:hypothetical protein